MKHTLVLFLLFTIFGNTVQSQGSSFTMDGRAIGVITFDNGVINGSAFVVNNPRQIVTCAHVIDTNRLMYYVTASLKLRRNYFKLKLIGLLRDCDLALLEADEDVCTTPFKIRPEEEGVNHFEPLIYMGYNSTLTTDSTISYKADTSSTAAVGTMREGNMLDKNFFMAHFIEFKGNAIPGYSGGPVLNTHGLAIGIITFAWLQRGIKGGETYIMNRALSLSPLARIKNFIQAQ